MDEDDNDNDSFQSDLSSELGFIPTPQDEDAASIFCSSNCSVDARGELWVKCVMCLSWAHNDCAGVEKTVYVYDFCR